MACKETDLRGEGHIVNNETDLRGAPILYEKKQI